MKEKLLYSVQIKKAKRKKIFSVIFLLLFIFTFTNLITHFLLFSVKQNSVSMGQDVKEKSLIMITPVLTKISRGDVILLNPRNSFDFSPMSLDEKKVSTKSKFFELVCTFFTFNQVSVKRNNNFPCSQYQLRRVICLPGDSFYMRDFVIYIKPKGEKHFLTEFELTPKKYNIEFTAVPAGWDSAIGVKGSFDEITLKEGQYFVLGDNRISCDDSRLIGPITKENICGKALFCYFPFTELKVY